MKLFYFLMFTLQYTFRDFMVESLYTFFREKVYMLLYFGDVKVYIFNNYVMSYSNNSYMNYLSIIITRLGLLGGQTK
jgi:hypothetical protein